MLFFFATIFLLAISIACSGERAAAPVEDVGNIDEVTQPVSVTPSAAASLSPTKAVGVQSPAFTPPGTVPPLETSEVSPVATTPAAAGEGGGEPSATATNNIPEPTVTTGSTPELSESESNVFPDSQAIIIDHTSIDDFERIPDEYIAAAQQLRMVYIDQSVGQNINEGLSCLSHASSSNAPNHCVRADHVVPEFSVAPEVINWNRAGGYDRSNWEFQPYSSECDIASWNNSVPCFNTMVAPVIDDYDVLSFQFSYFAVSPGSTIIDEELGFFSDLRDSGAVLDQVAFEEQYPDKVFIYWTTSLARGIGSLESDLFNEQMRRYALESGKPLFDVAAILSHDPGGNPCYDNRDGIPYDNGNNAENYPDDGQDFLAICQHYTTETDGGHLGSVSAGKIRVAKAFWVLMARIAGWDGQ